MEKQRFFFPKNDFEGTHLLEGSELLLVESMLYFII